MPFSPEAIANEILRLAEERGDRISPMKLQKLVYIAHGWSLGLTGRALINEPVLAWQYGPVISTLYHEFKNFGKMAITGKARKLKVDSLTNVQFYEPSVDYEDPDLAPVTKNLIEKVYDEYRAYTAMQLSDMTHSPNTPWYNATDAGQNTRDRVIKNGEIQRYYSELSS